MCAEPWVEALALHKLGMVVHICNPSPLWVRGRRIRSQSELDETLSQKKNVYTRNYQLFVNAERQSLGLAEVGWRLNHTELVYLLRRFDLIRCVTPLRKFF